MIRKILLIRTASLFLASSPMVLVLPIFNKNNLRENETYQNDVTIDADQTTMNQLTNVPPSMPVNFDNFKNGSFDKKYLKGADKPMAIPQEKFKSYENDEVTDVFIGDQAGIRLGGGLLFDVAPGDLPADMSSELKDQLTNKGTFGTSNFISTNTKEVRQDDDIPGIESTPEHQEWNEQTVVPGYPYPTTETIHHHTRTGDTIYPKTLDLTPSSKLEKNVFKNLFNMELFAWYWDTWGQNYVDKVVSEKNQIIANDITNNFLNTPVPNSPKINLSTAWNQVVTKQVSARSSIAAEFAGATFGTLVGEIGSAILGGAAGFVLGGLFSSILSFLSPDKYNVEINTQNFGQFYSNPLNKIFWDGYFDKYLGTPDNPDSNLPIRKFYNDYGKLPSDINMQSFNIYMSNINMTSSYKESLTFDDSVSHNSSYSTIDQSLLQLNLKTDFNLTRQSESIQELLNKLLEMNVTIEKSKMDTNDASNNQNASLIRARIVMQEPSLIDIAKDLTFTGNLDSLTEANKVNVYYKGINQNQSIDVWSY